MNRVFYDGSIDYSKVERLGGVASHLNKIYKEELMQLLGQEYEAVTMEQVNNSYRMTIVRMVNMNSGQERQVVVNAAPLPINTLDSTKSLLELLDSIISFYNVVVKSSLVTVARLRSDMSEYISINQDLKRQLEKIKKEGKSPSTEQELLRLIDIFNAKLQDQGRYLAWIRATMYSEEKQLQLSWLLKVITLTLTNASLKGNMFSFVPEFYLRTLAELCVSLRNYMHPMAPIHQIPDYQEMFLNIAKFLCYNFMDSRIINIESRNTLLLMLAGFVFNPLTLKAMEDVPEEGRVKLVTNLVKSYTKRVWAESNWILVRFWQGNGFAFRYERSPHLLKKIGSKPFQQDVISQPRST